MAARATVEVFEYEGTLSAVDARLRFTFRAYPDGSLTANVVRVSAAALVDGTEIDESVQTEEQPEGDGLDIDDVHGNDAQQIEADRGDMERTADEAEQAHRRGADREQEDAEAVVGMEEDEEIDRDATSAGDEEYLVFDGRCIAQFDPEHNNEHYFLVHFKLVQWSRRHFSSAVIHCVGNISAHRGFVGKCIPVDPADTREHQEFHIPLVAAHAQDRACAYPRSDRAELLDHQLYPLTPGSYELSGYTIAENGYVYRCLVRVTLHPNGKLTGCSQELLVPQKCAIEGTWSREELSYSMRYLTEDRVCTYIYHGSPFLGDLRGTWRNVDINTRRHLSERGCLALDVSAAHRRWSEAFHKEYPIPFQQCVKTLLLVALRADVGSAYAIPSCLWSHVFSFCGWNWFRDNGQVQQPSRNRATLVSNEGDGSRPKRTRIR